MIRAYNELYLNSVSRNIAGLFDVAINAEGLEVEMFSELFSNSHIAKGIEASNPKMLAGMSSTEMLIEIMDKNIEYTFIPVNRTPEYWAGWVLAYAQWYLNKSFSEILSVISFNSIIDLYNPYHEGPEIKTIELIASKFSAESTLKIWRQRRKLTQEELSILSGVNIRTIRSYEQKDNDLLKAQSEILYKLAKALDCNIENLLK